MTRKKTKKVAKKQEAKQKNIVGAIDRVDVPSMIEKMKAKPLSEHMKTQGRTGTVTMTDYYADPIIDKLIEEEEKRLEDELYGEVTEE